MNDRTEPAPMTPAAPPLSGPRTDRPGEAAAAAPERPPAGFVLRDFLSGGDNRLRDLLAFGMAVEAGRPLGPDGVAEFRRKADADLEAHAFRTLHNQAEAIRRQAVDDHLDRLPRGLSFKGVLLANLAAMALGLALIAAVAVLAPGAFGELHAYLAQLSARWHAGS